MKLQIYAGIDYSGPGSTVNRDAETGIRYGMISCHSVNPDALEDVYQGDDLGFEAAKKQVIDELANAIKSALEDYGTIDDDGAEGCATEIVESDDFQWADTDESGPYGYVDSDGTSVQTTSNNELWVFKSPYYTWAQFCSPCVPGAGNLNGPMMYAGDGVKTYCLGLDWFNKDSPCPYPIYKVEDDTIVHSVLE